MSELAQRRYNSMKVGHYRIIFFRGKRNTKMFVLEFFIIRNSDLISYLANVNIAACLKEFWLNIPAEILLKEK